MEVDPQKGSGYRKVPPFFYKLREPQGGARRHQELVRREEGGIGEKSRSLSRLGEVGSRSHFVSERSIVWQWLTIGFVEQAD